MHDERRTSSRGNDDGTGSDGLSPVDGSPGVVSHRLSSSQHHQQDSNNRSRIELLKGEVARLTAIIGRDQLVELSHLHEVLAPLVSARDLRVQREIKKNETLMEHMRELFRTRELDIEDLSASRDRMIARLDATSAENCGYDEIEAAYHKYCAEVEVLQQEHAAVKYENANLERMVEGSKLRWHNDRRTTLDALSRTRRSLFEEVMPQIQQAHDDLNRQQRGIMGMCAHPLLREPLILVPRGITIATASGDSVVVALGSHTDARGHHPAVVVARGGGGGVVDGSTNGSATAGRAGATAVVSPITMGSSSVDDLLDGTSPSGRKRTRKNVAAAHR